MATRGRASFQKKQKELARKEKQQRKVERREQKKSDRAALGDAPAQTQGTGQPGRQQRHDLARAEQPRNWRPEAIEEWRRP